MKPICSDRVDRRHQRPQSRIRVCRFRETHKEEAHEDAADGLARLGEVIILDGGGDLGRPFSTHRFRGFGVLEDLEVVLLLDLERDPVVDAQLEEDDRRVKDARVQEHGRVLKVDLARDLGRALWG